MTLKAAIYGRQSRGKEKSISEQVETCSADAIEQGWQIVATYRDRTSASRYRRQDREQWPIVVEAVRNRAFDVLVMWSSSRGDRDLTSWSGLLDAARSSGVLVRITDDARTYDVRRSGDWQMLAQQGVSNATDSDKISAGVKRGQSGAAALGRPAHGRVPYGYRRVYDPRNGALVGQEPDPKSAPVVKEIFARVAEAEPISTIAADLQNRDVPRPEKGRWHRQRVRDIATNPVYISRRVHGDQLYTGAWEPLVESTTYYAALRVLRDPARVTTRPGRQKHLLSYIARCNVCSGHLCVVRARYRCVAGCVTITQAKMDELVTEAVLTRLAEPQIYLSLRRAGEDADQVAVQAWIEADGARAELDRWRRSAARGETSPESLAVIEAELRGKIARAEAKAKRAEVPPALRAVLDPDEDVRVRWERMTLPAKRLVISYLIPDLRVAVAARPGGRSFEARRLNPSRWRWDRITWGELATEV